MASGSSGLSGNTSKIPRPRISSRCVIVACKYASLTAVMIRSGVRTRYRPGLDSNSARKSGWLRTRPSGVRSSGSAPVTMLRASGRRPCHRTEKAKAAGRPNSTVFSGTQGRRAGREHRHLDRRAFDVSASSLAASPRDFLSLRPTLLSAHPLKDLYLAAIRARSVSGFFRWAASRFDARRFLAARRHERVLSEGDCLAGPPTWRSPTRPTKRRPIHRRSEREFPFHLDGVSSASPVPTVPRAPIGHGC